MPHFPPKWLLFRNSQSSLSQHDLLVCVSVCLRMQWVFSIMSLCMIFSFLFLLEHIRSLSNLLICVCVNPAQHTLYINTTAVHLVSTGGTAELSHKFEHASHSTLLLHCFSLHHTLMQLRLSKLIVSFCFHPELNTPA